MSNIKKNFIYLMIYKMFEFLLPLMTSPLLARRLGAESLGIYIYVYSIASIFIIIGELGLYRYGIREIAKYRDDKNQLSNKYSELFYIHIFNIFCVMLIYVLFILIFERNSELFTLYLIQIGFFISNALDISFFFVGIENVKIISIRDFIIKILTLILIYFCIYNPSDLIFYSLIMVISPIFTKFITLLYAKNFINLKNLSDINLKYLKYHYKPMIILLIPAIASVCYQSIDRIILGYFVDKIYVAFYDCASKTLIFKTIITTLGLIICPRISNLYFKGNNKEVNRLIEKSMMISLIIAYFVTFNIISIAKEFAPFFWGENFSYCSDLMIYLSLCIPLWTIGEVIRNQYLLPLNKDGEYTFAFLVGVIINIIINVILIPYYGVIGAIIAMIFAEFIMSCIQLYLVRNEINWYSIIFNSVPYIVAAIIACIFNKNFIEYLYKNYLIVIFMKIIIGNIIFLVISLLCEKLFNKKYILNLLNYR